ncbi:MAG: helix-turn-helix transcriptional regulator, partial [Butyrivibrio sp.]|nr:helix-turn-helix transcriptional regulator [Butyrivibrio sp.]
MTLKEIKARKKKLGWTNKELAQRSGVPLSTVNKIMGNATLTPRIDT